MMKTQVSTSRTHSKYHRYLDQALKAIFRSTNSPNIGFWNELEGRIIKSINWGGEKQYFPDLTIEFRYAPFCLMGVLYWRQKQIRSNHNYDEKIIQYLNFLRNQIHFNGKANKDISGFEYGLLLICFSLGSLIFKEQSFLIKAKELYEYINKKITTIKDNQHSFILSGLTYLIEALENVNGTRVNPFKLQLENHVNYILKNQDKSGIYQIGDRYASHHQRLCYMTWALARAASILKNDKIILAIERTIDQILEFRTSYDFGFRWHDPINFVKLSHIPFKFPINQPYGSDLLFSCHQAFFVVATEQYKAAGGGSDYRQESKRALEWIWGKNRRNLDLVKYSGVDVPWRVMNFNGDLHIQGQNFVGSYEIGAYIMALCDVVSNLTLNRYSVT